MGSNVRALIVAAMTVAAWPVQAETGLTDFVGEWHGAGTDRNTPLESSQHTNCRMAIRADQRHMSSDTTCDGQAGLHKVLRMSITLSGTHFTGNASQAVTPRDGATSTLHGTIVGQKSDENASLDVHFSGLTPTATVLLTRSNPSTFNMHITALGMTLMDVTFHRAAKR